MGLGYLINCQGDRSELSSFHVGNGGRSVDDLNFFSQEAEKEITVEGEPTTQEEEIDNIDLVDPCEEMEALERSVKMQKHLIQQVKLEIDGEKRQQSILQGEKHPVD
jgi:hypothetical protein